MPGTRLYVGNLPSDTTKRDLEDFFKTFGKIDDISLKKGYGFVEFEDGRDADDAAYELDGKKLLGKRITVERARGVPRGEPSTSSAASSSSTYRSKKPIRTKYRLYVENLASSVSWRDLKEQMREVAEVTYADAHRYYLHEGVVEFATYSDMKRALERFNETVINGKKIYLTEDEDTKPKRRRSSTRSSSYRSRSRSSSKSRSRSRSRSYSKSYSRSRSRSRRSSRSRTRSRSYRSKSERSDYSDRSRSRSRSSRRTRSRSHSRSSRRSYTKSYSKSYSRSRSKSR
ncbi:serine-arginine protein 55-like [Aethina tumida]|uniref:serine-arginine protein 55-like n=1 Tax=Aethina tumida TaxID=116153 RepID=UPI0021473B88|nr:serine-arginine protein 55-like [Aethina tumida]XP_049824293.1 serine-arginine protein 55-like [Aethina tumida]